METNNEYKIKNYFFKVLNISNSPQIIIKTNINNFN